MKAFMETKIFNDKKIIIRPLAEKDIKQPEKWQDFINSLVKEEAQILENKKISLKEAKQTLRNKFEETKNNKTIFILAEEGEKMVARAEIYKNKGACSHTGQMRIAVKKDCRGL